MKIWNKIKSSVLWIGLSIVGVLGIIAAIWKIQTNRQNLQ
jgi:hypothetical protein